MYIWPSSSPPRYWKRWVAITLEVELDINLQGRALVRQKYQVWKEWVSVACSHPFFIRAGHSAIHHIFNARLCNNWKWINPSVPSSFLALSNSKLYITYCTYYFIAHNVVTSVPIPLLPYVFCFAVPSSTHTCWYLLVRGYLHDFINYLSCKTCTHHIAMYIE